MQVELKFFGPFRDDVGEKTVQWETDAETVGELLDEVRTEWPALEDRLVDEEAGTTAGETVVSLNKKNVKHIDGLDTELSAGDVVRMVPSVYGG